MKKITFLCLLILGFSTQAFTQETINITVSINGPITEVGNILASIVNDPSGFPSASNAIDSRSVKAENDLSINFENILPDAIHAITLFQDLNENGKLDMNGGMPAKPFGFSNYVMMGPPQWGICSFEATEDMEVNIPLYSF